MSRGKDGGHLKEFNKSDSNKYGVSETARSAIAV